MRKIPKIDEMLPSDIEEYLKIINKKYIKIDFERVLDRKLPSELTEIVIGKKAFLNNLDKLIKYINYFIEYYDDDDELMAAYFGLMFSISNKDVNFDVEQLVIYLKNYFSSDSMIDKIGRMVEHNMDESMIKKTDKKYDESLQLTSDHLKAILGISIMHKIIIPIISHYYKIRKNLVKITEKELYFRCFTCFLDSFDERYDIKFYDKLYHTATTRVSKTQKNQSNMWRRRERLGVTPISYVNTLMRDFFVDISQKAIFSKSAIVFIHVCFDKAITHELFQQDKFEFNDMAMESSDSVNEEVTRFDKMLINNAKVSEKYLIRSYVSIKDTINRLANEYGVEFEDDEIEFYRNSINLDEVQINLIFLYFSPYFESYENLKHIKVKELIKLIILMKVMLKKSNYIYIPQLISGKLDKAKAKRFNKKKIEKFLTSHPKYEELVEQYKDAKSLINKDKLLSNIRALISSPLYLIDYNHKDKIGKKININEVTTIDEIVRLIDAL